MPASQQTASSQRLRADTGTSSPPPAGAAADGPSRIPTRASSSIHLAEDQKDIWTSPFHFNAADAKWLVPMGGIATGLFVTDPQSSYAMRLDNQHPLNLAANAGVAAAAGLTGAAYIWGHMTHNERARETGVLATEAMINAIGVDYAIEGHHRARAAISIELPEHLFSRRDVISVGPCRRHMGIRFGGCAGVSPSWWRKSALMVWLSESAWRGLRRTSTFSPMYSSGG